MKWENYFYFKVEFLEWSYVIHLYFFYNFVIFSINSRQFSNFETFFESSNVIEEFQLPSLNGKTFKNDLKIPVMNNRTRVIKTYNKIFFKTNQRVLGNYKIRVDPKPNNVTNKCFPK